MATIDSLAAQEQLHYQILNQKLDNLYTNLNSSINERTTYLANLVNNQTNRLGGEIYSNVNRAIDNYNGRSQYLQTQALDTMRGLFNADFAKQDAILRSVEAKVNEQATRILQDAEKREGIITTNLRQVQTAILSQIGITEGNLNRNTAKLVSDLKDNLIKIDEDNDNVLKSLTGKLTETLKNVVIDSESNVVDAISNSNGFSDPTNPLNLSWLDMFIANLLYGTDFQNVEGQGLTSAFKEAFLGNGSVNLSQMGGFTGFAAQSLSDQVSMIQTIIKNTSEGRYSTLEEFYADFKKIGVDTDFTSSVLQFIFIIPALLQLGQQLTTPFQRRMDQLITAQYNLTPMESGAIISLYRSNNISYAEGVSKLEYLGYTTQDARELLNLGHTPLNPEWIFKLAYRGNFGMEEVQKYLLKNGYQMEDVPLLAQVMQPRPSIQDLIQFAVKEVFSYEQANKFGQYQEFPPDFAREAKLAGLSDQDAQRYWAAHWQLPSPQMGYEMFHRGIISQEDLNNLLKSLDIMPYWRDKLTKLNYNVIGRVDTRRLYAYNLYSEQDVYKSYLDQGYSPNDAKKLTEFTVKYDAEQDEKHKSKLKNLTYAQLLKAYRRKVISRETCKQEIIKLGYDNQEVEWLLSITDYDIYLDTHEDKTDTNNKRFANLSIKAYNARTIGEQDLRDNLKEAGYNEEAINNELKFAKLEYSVGFKSQVSKAIQEQYFEGLMTGQDVLNALISLEFSPSEATTILGEMQILNTYRTKKPTIAQFTKLFKNGDILEDEYIEILKGEGYTDKYIPYMLRLAVPEGDE